MPDARSHAEAAATAAVVGSNRARYCAGVKKWRYSALPGVEIARTVLFSAAWPPFGARYTRTLTGDDADAARTGVARVAHPGRLPRRVMRDCARAPVAPARPGTAKITAVTATIV